MTCDALICLGTIESVQPFLNTISASIRIFYLIESIPTFTESDSFTQAKLAMHRGYLREFDCVLAHTPRSRLMLEAQGAKRVETLLWPAFPTIYRRDPAAVKDIDVLFVGGASAHRNDILLAAARRFPVKVEQQIFHAAAAAFFNRAKVVLNIHYTPLRNFECRVSEALSCGAFLMTIASCPIISSWFTPMRRNRIAAN